MYKIYTDWANTMCRFWVLLRRSTTVAQNRWNDRQKSWEDMKRLGLVAPVCSLSYSRGRDWEANWSKKLSEFSISTNIHDDTAHLHRWEDYAPRPVPGKTLRPYLKKTGRGKKEKEKKSHHGPPQNKTIHIDYFLKK
jgi:hypothetical protein